MKDALKRAAQAMGLVANDAVAEVVSDAVEAEAASVGQLQIDVTTLGSEELSAALSDLQVKADAKEVELATALSELAEAKAALTDVTAALDALKAANAQAAATALAAKMTARHKAIVTALGTERADAFMEATKEMPDAQFSTVMAAMTASVAAEASTPEFTEVGVDAQADVAALQAEAASNGTAEILKAKYQQKAAN